MRRHAFLIMALAALCAPAAGQRGGGYIEPVYVEPEPEPEPTPPPATTPPAVVIPSYQVRPTPPPPPPPRVTPAERRAAEDELAAFTSPTLTRFTGEAEFARYRRALRAVSHARNYSHSGAIQFASLQADTQTPLCPDPNNPDCAVASDEGAQNVIVSGARIAPRNPSITNNQMANVEEGDIVKQIDHYLLVLQDGRLFVIDMNGPGRGGRALRLVDRVNVYRDPHSDAWYDEMLVHGDRILVTGYSYEEGATELAVFRMDEAGHLASQGVFHISSNDYYSSNNYATRLIGDSLIVYTPLEIDIWNEDEFKIPVVRRWHPGEEREDAERRGRPLFDARSIYRPVRTIEAPTVHTVSVCPLGPVGPARDLECRTRAMIGPAARQWYVTADDAFLWMAEDSDYDVDQCEAPSRFSVAGANPALLYRVPVAEAPPTVAGTRGAPPDQFALQAGDGRFHALLQWDPRECRRDYEDPPALVYLAMPLAGFANRLAEQPGSAYTPLPSTGSNWTVDRFTDRYLVYGGLNQYRRGLPEIDPDDYATDPEGLARARARIAILPAYVVPIDRPQGVRPIAVRHTVIRAEQVGSDIVLTGYRDGGGLVVSLIDLDGAPRLASQTRLDGRYESEGRSHAFNSLVERDGSGLMGLPTVPRVEESGRYWWRSRASDLSYLEFDADGGVSPLGELARRFEYSDDGEGGVPGYSCEVSCVDWYGNSRPIFTDGRIFGLSGTELIEGRVERGRIREVQRLNIALESERRR